MTTNDYLALLPFFFLLGGGALLLFIESFFVDIAKRWSAKISLATYVLAFLAALKAPAISSPLLTHWLTFDTTAHFSTLFILFIGMATNLLSYALFQRHPTSRSEYEFFVLMATIGLLLIASAADFLVLFLGLEILSISLYILTGYMRNWSLSGEASLKYFLLGAIGAAFLVYGIALLYGSVGSTQFAGLLDSYKALQGQSLSLFWGGIVFITVGLGFKAAIFPLQFWAPDAYEGAPTPVTAFMSVGVKTGAILAFVRVFFVALPGFSVLWSEAIAFLAMLSLIYSNFLALRQFSLRRFFAYSGISHSGFLLIAIAAQGPEALSALLFYLVIYALATMGAFAVLALLDRGEGGVHMEDLKGLAQNSPFLACILAFSLLTLAGIPPTAGFFAKLYLFKAAMEAGYYGLVILALLTTVLAFYYYLRIVSLFFVSPSHEFVLPLYSRPVLLLIGAASFGLLILSLIPDSLLQSLYFPFKIFSIAYSG